MLIEALPWLERFHGAIVVIKYGGNAMIDAEVQARVRRRHGVPALRRAAAGRGARRRPADHRHAGPARDAKRVPGRPAGDHAGDDGRRPDGAGRPGRPGAGRADQRARPVRRRHVRRGRPAVHRGPARPCWSTAGRSTSAWSATSPRSTRARCSTSIAAGRIPVVVHGRAGRRRRGAQPQRRHRGRRAGRRARRREAGRAHRRGGPLRATGRTRRRCCREIDRRRAGGAAAGLEAGMVPEDGGLPARGPRRGRPRRTSSTAGCRTRCCWRSSPRGVRHDGGPDRRTRHDAPRRRQAQQPLSARRPRSAGRRR